MSLSKVCKFVALLTPTYQLYRLIRRKSKNVNVDSFTLSKTFDGIFLLIAIGLTIAHFAVEIFELSFWNNFLLKVFYALLVIQISRNIEIPFAFLSDVIDKLNTDGFDSSEKNSFRIELSVLVYFEILLNYALIYSILPFESWKCCLSFSYQWVSELTYNTLSIFNSIYFSIVTLATLGYGDITPIKFLSKLLSMTEVMTSFVIVILSITIYISTSRK